MKHQLTPALLLIAGCTLVGPQPAGRCDVPVGPTTTQVPAPRLDHHQHLLSEAARSVTVEWLRTIDSSFARQTESEPLVNADQLVQALDSAGIPKALVLSNASWFSRSGNEQPGEYAKVRAENDWVLSQVKGYPDRLYAACAVNPRRSHAVAEIERCAASGGFKALKMHFDASGVDLTNPDHVASVRLAFATANREGLPIVAHLQSEAGPYGGAQTRTFLTEIMPAAPDVPVMVNHLWGGGLYVDGPAETLTVFAEAFKRKDQSTRNLWFDVAQASMMVRKHKERAQLVEKMREIGFTRMLYGSDGSQWNGVSPKEHWDEFAACMPMTRDELDSVATNIVPYLQ